MNIKRFTLMVGIILAAAAMRLLPHPPNFSPIAALALFGGAYFSDKRSAFAVPLVAMFLGDLVLGLHIVIPLVYACFAIIVCLGMWVRRNRNIWRIGGAALASSILFFTVTNFGVWALTNMYSKDMAGLSLCYVAAIPFFWNTLAGDLFYTTVIFGFMALAEHCIPAIREIEPMQV
jgi:hypothetical protein